jgi:hypothetical protein
LSAVTIFHVLHQQGDQIGRIFAQWAIFYFKQILENYKSRPHFCATFFPSTGYELILTENGLGNILGNFFTNSSGRPVHRTKQASHGGLRSDGANAKIFLSRVARFF